MSDRLVGRVAFVTGAGSGIGAAIARALSGEGASLVLLGRRRAPLEEVAASLPAESACFECDVRSSESVDEALRRGLDRFGRIDILVNNAGIFGPRAFEETTPEVWADLIATNLTGAYLWSHAAWSHLAATRGQIVNVSSIAGTRGYRGCSAYCASKFGLNGLSEVLALEGAPLGIRVFSVCPGSVDTPLWHPHSTEAERERMMEAEDVASLVLWLVTSDRGIAVQPVVITNFRDPFEG
jgi:NAD(P)-dependent dehydrogenase (short-subunit alcohol dehydrogenase family)